jgi:hypothetical protein
VQGKYLLRLEELDILSQLIVAAVLAVWNQVHLHNAHDSICVTILEGTWYKGRWIAELHWPSSDTASALLRVHSRAWHDPFLRTGYSARFISYIHPVGTKPTT